MLREVEEETGLILTSYRFRGLVTFCSEIYPTEYMCLYTADEFLGELKACDEGKLEWVKKEKLAELNLWDGDLLFFDLIQREEPFFSLKLCYGKNGCWKQAVLNGRELELFDVCDKDGNPTGHVMERGMVHRMGIIHRTSHIWVIRKSKEGKTEVLLQKRSAKKDSYPGCYDISSAGHIHAGDQYENAARRELEEELGLVADEEDLRFIGIHEGKIKASFWGEDFIDHEISAVYLYERPVDPERLKLQESEVEAAVFMDYEEVCKKMKDGTLANCIYPEEFAMIKAALQPNFSAENVWIKEIICE